MASDAGMNAEDIADLCEAALSGGKSAVVDVRVVKQMAARMVASRGRKTAGAQGVGSAVMMDDGDVGDTSFETMLGLGEVSTLGTRSN